MQGCSFLGRKRNIDSNGGSRLGSVGVGFFNGGKFGFFGFFFGFLGENGKASIFTSDESLLKKRSTKYDYS